MRTLKIKGPRNTWIVYLGFVGKWGDHVRLVRLNRARRVATGGWTLWKGPRP